MEEAWGRAPNRFQIEILPSVVQMLTKDLTPEALLLVQRHVSCWVYLDA